MLKELKTHFPDIIRKEKLLAESPKDGFYGYLFEGREGSQIIFWECDEEVTVEPHKHEYDEYCLVVEGICKETIEGEEFVLEAGDEIVIPAGKTHWATMGPNYRAIDFFGGPRCKYKEG
jgi:quercetin dioxygenase-like cupin family protein